MRPALKSNLMRLLRPRHVAVLGGVDATTVAKECRRIGYDGPFWPVNPKRDNIGGFPCFGSVDDLPEPPDAVFIAVPREQAIESLGKLSAMGAGGAVVYTAGFSEIAGDGGQMEADLISAAGDMALIGPNCYGLINYVDRVALWPFAHGGTFTGRGAAIITQSGMLSSDLTMAQRALPMSYMLSVGNQSVLRIEDFIDTLVDLPEVSAIGVHVEGIVDACRFEAAALKALANKVPIVVLKTGTSKLGSELTVSHTGSLSGADEVYSAFFDRLGIIRVDEPAGLLETLKFLTVAGVPKGHRLAALACSGGGATMVADHAEKLGLELPRPSGKTEATLRQQLPLTATVSNPLDYTTPIWGMPDKTEPVFATLFEDGYDAAVIIQDYPAAGLDESKIFYRNDSISFINAARAAGLPGAVCSTVAENLDDETRSFLIENRIAPMQGIGDCMKAIAAAAHYGAHRDALLAVPSPGLVRARPDKSEGNPVMLDEVAAKSFLGALGVPVPKGVILGDAVADALPQGMSLPLAIKVVSPDVAHKSDIGAVKLNITSLADLNAGLVGIRDNFKTNAPDAKCVGFLVESMAAPPIAEIMVSLRRDPTFGIVMTLASGGILVELIKDSTTILMPTNRAGINAAIDRLAIAKIIAGYRGNAVGDRDALVDAITLMADAMINDHSLLLIEVNPLFVSVDGVCAVDALITRTKPV